MKEWLLPEDHGSQHAAQTPHVQTVVVHLIVHQQLRTLAVIVGSNNRRERRGKTDLEISAGHPHVVLLAGVVELGQPPVDQSQSPVLVVDHHVVRLHVAVHDAHAVAVVQGPQQLVQISPDIVVSQCLAEK